MYLRHEIFERDFSRRRPAQNGSPRVRSPDFVCSKVPFPNSKVNCGRCQSHALLTLSQRLIFGDQLGDVYTRSDITGECSLRVITWDAVVRYPAIIAIGSSQPVLHNEKLPHVERVGINVHAFFQVIFMHAFSPAVSKLLFHSASCKLQPRLVKKCAKLVYASHPDENGRSIRHDSKT